MKTIDQELLASMTDADVRDVLSVAANMAMLGRGDNANSLLLEVAYRDGIKRIPHDARMAWWRTRMHVKPKTTARERSPRE